MGSVNYSFNVKITWPNFLGSGALEAKRVFVFGAAGPDENTMSNTADTDSTFKTSFDVLSLQNPGVPPNNVKNYTFNLFRSSESSNSVELPRNIASDPTKIKLFLLIGYVTNERTSSSTTKGIPSLAGLTNLGSIFTTSATGGAVISTNQAHLTNVIYPITENNTITYKAGDVRFLALVTFPMRSFNGSVVNFRNLIDYTIDDTGMIGAISSSTGNSGGLVGAINYEIWFEGTGSNTAEANNRRASFKVERQTDTANLMTAAQLPMHYRLSCDTQEQCPAKIALMPTFDLNIIGDTNILNTVTSLANGFINKMILYPTSLTTLKSSLLSSLTPANVTSMINAESDFYNNIVRLVTFSLADNTALPLTYCIYNPLSGWSAYVSPNQRLQLKVALKPMNADFFSNTYSLVSSCFVIRKHNFLYDESSTGQFPLSSIGDTGKATAADKSPQKDFGFKYPRFSLTPLAAYVAEKVISRNFTPAQTSPLAANNYTFYMTNTNTFGTTTDDRSLLPLVVQAYDNLALPASDMKNFRAGSIVYFKAFQPNVGAFNRNNENEVYERPQSGSGGLENSQMICDSPNMVSSIYVNQSNGAVRGIKIRCDDNTTYKVGAVDSNTPEINIDNKTLWGYTLKSAGTNGSIIRLDTSEASNPPNTDDRREISKEDKLTGLNIGYTYNNGTYTINAVGGIQKAKIQTGRNDGM